MYRMWLYKPVIVVLFYNGGIITFDLNDVRRYVGKKTIVRIWLEVEKLSVSYIRNMFDCVFREFNTLETHFSHHPFREDILETHSL